MNFDYSDEQKSLKGEVRRVLDQHCTPRHVRAVLDDPATSFDRALWARAAELGWTGAAIPESYGGSGLGHVELCAIAEELGRALAPISFASTVYMVAEAVMLAGNDAQKDWLLPRIAAGELIGCLAVSEGPGPWSAGALQCRVQDGRLSGAKIPVTDGDCADVALVLALEGGRPGLFLVDLNDAETVRRETLKTLDPTRGAARLTFTGAPVRPVGGAGEGAELTEAVMDRAAVLIAFEQLGGADRCLELARAYALERQAFGRPIGGYQAIKHKLADMYVKNELARSNAYYGAWALGADGAELPLAAAAARVAASEAFGFAARENVQVHGGMGFTWEVDAHLYYRRAKALGLVVGAPARWKERLVSQLERRNAA